MKVKHYMDREMNGQFAKQAMKKKTKKMCVWRQVMWFMFVAEIMYLGCIWADKVKAQEPVKPTAQVIIKEVEPKAPILARIAKCESPSGHRKNGQVSLNANRDGSVDIGKYQINNRAWGKKAAELGYNLEVEADNESMAHWIYANKGTQPWYSSDNCWMK